MFKPEKILKISKVIFSICGGWWSAMSGAISVPFAFVALYSNGNHAKARFAILAFIGLWIMVFRMGWKNYQVLIVKPLNIIALPMKAMPHSDYVFACNLAVQNSNQSVSSVKLKLVAIEPPFKSFQHITTNCFDLSYLKFSHESELHQNDKTIVRIFEVSKDTSAPSPENLGIIRLMFAAKLADGSASPVFWPEISGAAVSNHILTFEASAAGVAAQATKFNMKFSLLPGTPLFELAEIKR